MIKNITIDEKSKGQRLDKFLTVKLKDKTRSQIKKMINQGLVEVDGKAAKVHHFLKAGQTVTITKSGTEKKPAAAEKQSKIIDPKIIFEDSNFLVIDKPTGLLVHPTDRGETNTLVNWLIKKYPKIKNVGEQKYRAGIIHRLDKDVSGIMVVAKTNQAFSHLKNQFKNRTVKKEYLALVYGRIEQQAGEIDLPIGRSKNGQFVAHPLQGKEKFAEADKFAKTRYSVLEYVKDYTLLQVQILTGRTHQIRAHLSAIGHPILGDQIYKPKKKFFNFLRRKIKVIYPGRIFLHSTKIGFKDLKNNFVEFSAEGGSASPRLELGTRAGGEYPLPQKLTSFLNDQKTK